ncbi:MAG: hypothetical protein AMQ22_01906 [Candidatus Methanofastidiosum methylothiophilum]|jgi:hypothetical protein|uniref:Uncharacterized protein n=1 Tax=Candidatus Methanofastidiosum methylothiophilum TaxID=1705564 RepID=A0A150ISQ1_9EURY|nr:MAG: hypothetical protein AMQ22_01906 [Candidatus Methanofastidiosum methylthiophilus]
MAKIRHPKTFSKVFNIDAGYLYDKGIFDPVLNVDTKLFIDPILIEKSGFDYFRNEVMKAYEDHYNSIISLLEESKTKDDLAWRSAKRLIQRKEVEGTCLGYGVNSISGRSLSPKLQNCILSTAKEIIDIGIKKPELFILLPLFEEGVGPDTISDITTAAVQASLYNFTAIIAHELGIKTSVATFRGNDIEIITNPLKSKISPIVLLPKDVLRQLPYASTWEEISDVAQFNHELRMRVNKYIGKIWAARTKREKEKEKQKVMKNKEALEILLEAIKNTDVKPYNFEIDENGVYKWRDVMEGIADKYPKKLSKPSNDADGLVLTVREIINQFKFIIEEKGMNKLLWKNRSTPNHENVSQMLFFSTAYSYCKANDLDINPEMDTGNGLVDFKFSKGFSKRLIVEIKHSYNQNIIDGFDIQLRLYKKAEETCFGFYIVIDVGRLGRKFDKLVRMYNESTKKADLFYINGKIKPSASKRKE